MITLLLKYLMILECCTFTLNKNLVDYILIKVFDDFRILCIYFE